MSHVKGIVCGDRFFWCALPLLLTLALGHSFWATSLHGFTIGSGMAITALLLLGLDPTVSAHIPVMMTDLPMARLGTISLSLAILAVRDHR